MPILPILVAGGKLLRRPRLSCPTGEGRTARREAPPERSGETVSGASLPKHRKQRSRLRRLGWRRYASPTGRPRGRRPFDCTQGEQSSCPTGRPTAGGHSPPSHARPTGRPRGRRPFDCTQGEQSSCPTGRRRPAGIRLRRMPALQDGDGTGGKAPAERGGNTVRPRTGWEPAPLGRLYMGRWKARWM